MDNRVMQKAITLGIGGEKKIITKDEKRSEFSLFFYNF